VWRRSPAFLSVPVNLQTLHSPLRLKRDPSHRSRNASTMPATTGLVPACGTSNAAVKKHAPRKKFQRIACSNGVRLRMSRKMRHLRNVSLAGENVVAMLNGHDANVSVAHGARSGEPHDRADHFIDVVVMHDDPNLDLD